MTKAYCGSRIRLIHIYLCARHAFCLLQQLLITRSIISIKKHYLSEQPRCWFHDCMALICRLHARHLKRNTVHISANIIYFTPCIQRHLAKLHGTVPDGLHPSFFSRQRFQICIQKKRCFIFCKRYLPWHGRSASFIYISDRYSFPFDYTCICVP